MLMQIIFLLMGMMTVIVMILVRTLFSENSTKEKYNFECGYESLVSSRLPFSLNFFMISLVFILFDLEIIILVCVIPSTSFNFLNPYTMSQVLLLFMFMGLLMEWMLSKLKWLF